MHRSDAVNDSLLQSELSIHPAHNADIPKSESRFSFSSRNVGVRNERGGLK